MCMADQRMSQSEFAVYIAQRIRAGYSQSRAPQVIALSGIETIRNRHEMKKRVDLDNCQIPIGIE